MSKVQSETKSSKKATGGLAWMEQAFAGMREQADHLHVLLCDAQGDFPPLGIEESTAYTLEQIAPWSMQFRTGLAQVREALEQEAASDTEENERATETVLS